MQAGAAMQDSCCITLCIRTLTFKYMVAKHVSRIYIVYNVKLRLIKFAKGSHCAMNIRGKIIQCERYFCLLLANLY